MSSLPKPKEERPARVSVEVDVGYATADVSMGDIETEALVTELKRRGRFTSSEIADAFGITDQHAIEHLYYATRADIWTRETHDRIRSLLAEMAGRVA